MPKVLKDPLLHFLLLGCTFFFLYEWLAVDSQVSINQSQEIVVTEGRIKALTQNYSKVWQRPPSAQELEGLIEEHIREEILYREALAMGLDRDDTIVRRRMRQKIEFLSEDITRLDEPSDEELRAFLAAQPARFRKESRFTFKQVYINTEKRGSSAKADAQAILAELRNNDENALESGDRLMVEHRFDNQPEREIKRALGSEFLEALATCPTGSWQGPIASGYGLHLVHLSERIDGKIPELTQVRDAVFREWSAEERIKANEAFYEMLRDRYTITVMFPEPESSSPVEATETIK